MREIGHRESDAILGAMRQMALAGGRGITHADTASILAAGALHAAPSRFSDIGDAAGKGPDDLHA